MLHFIVRRAASAAVVACVALASNSAYAVVVWDESIHGDISTNRLAPSSAALVLGSNTLTATSVGPTATADREYITLSVPAERKLNKIVLLSYASLDNIAFIGVQSGTTFTEPPTGTNVTNILGYTHFGPDALPVGANVLPSMGFGPGAIGFDSPLGAGSYTFWIQQTGPNPATYTFDFTVVPEPSAMALLAIGGVMACISRRRASRRA